ncbi:hypothetical protein EB796_006255 [Bugula neritina]|uniref:Uncharacterized protein n=1 Tax=Bugula neritina TaxID=10212 RepID=A0A7J7KB57_BUGNE|nr:hypothetical protein EB796_006255 [Bugula neritina]
MNADSARLRGDMPTANEFRNSYIMPLPKDPFADHSSLDMFSEDNHVTNDNPAVNDNPAFTDYPASTVADTSLYSMADEPSTKKLIPSRPAPQVPPIDIWSHLPPSNGCIRGD